MWEYTDRVKDHFLNPRNVGEIQDADGNGEVGSMACGDALRFTFKLDPATKRIADAKFKTFGCGSAIASASALTELVKGKTIEEALRITNKDIAEFLGGLPEQKMHCSVMGREALEAAVENFQSGGRIKHTVEGRVVCRCFGVTEKEIERVIRENNLTTVEQITHYTKAGGGCGSCAPDLEEILARMVAERQPRSGMTNLQKIRKIEEVIETVIRPALKNDGGDVELIDVSGNEVTIQLHSACANCPASKMTVRDFIQKELRERVMPELTVKAQR